MPKADAPQGRDWVILLPGDLVMTPRLRAQTARAGVIAADAGIRHAEALGRKPELWIGDFDSSTPADLLIHSGVPRRAYPADKDATDGALAMAEARKRGARAIFLLGAFGGCSAHAFSHLVQIQALAARGLRAMAADGLEEAWGLAPGRHEFDFPPNTKFSILGLSALEGLSVSGARWPLKDAAIPAGSTRTMSNETTKGPLAISLKAGAAVLLARLEPCERPPVRAASRSPRGRIS